MLFLIGDDVVEHLKHCRRKVSGFAALILLFSLLFIILCQSSMIVPNADKKCSDPVHAGNSSEKKHEFILPITISDFHNKSVVLVKARNNSQPFNDKRLNIILFISILLDSFTLTWFYKIIKFVNSIFTSVSEISLFLGGKAPPSYLKLI
jgi:hypothetical protein